MRSAATSFQRSLPVQHATRGLSIGPRAASLLLAVVYCSALYFAYNFYLSPIWGYLGFPPYDPSASGSILLLGVTAVFVFAVLMPTKIQHYSQFMSCILFYFIYIPCMVIVPMQGLGESKNLYLILALTISFACIAFIPLILAPKVMHEQSEVMTPQKRAIDTRFENRIAKFNFSVLVVFGITVLILLAVFGRSLNVVSMVDVQDLYAHRAQLAQETTTIFGMAYLLSWFAKVLCTYIVAVGLLERRWVLVALGAAGMLLFYSIVAAKYIPFAFVLLLLLRFFCFRTDYISPRRIGAVLVGGLLFSLMLMLIVGPSARGIVGLLVSQSVMRFYGNPGAQMGIYSEFIKVYGYTYYSQVNIFSSLFYEYPFQRPLGQMVGWFWANEFGYNANASFWATDGIASFGNWGVIFIGLILAAYTTLMDRLMVRSDFKIVCLSSFLTIWSLVDSSFFSFLLTGGAFFHVFLAMVYSKPKAVYVARPRPGHQHIVRHALR